MIPTKKNSNLKQEAENTAMEFQTLMNQIKLLELEAEKKKKQLTAFVEKNPKLLSENKFRFECGVLVTKTMSEKLKFEDENNRPLLLDGLWDKYIQLIINEPLLIKDSKQSKTLIKMMNTYGCSVDNIMGWRVNK